MNNMKKTMPLLMAVLTMILLLGFAAPASATDYAVSDSTELDGALALVVNNDVIQLLNDIDYDGCISIDGITITFDVNGYILTVTNASGTALNVTSGGKVNMMDTSISGRGAFNVIGGAISAPTVNVFGANSYASVSNVYNPFTGNSQGVAANQGGHIRVSGNIVVDCETGVSANGSAEVGVGGNVILTNSGTSATGVIVGGAPGQWSHVIINGALSVPATGNYLATDGYVKGIGDGTPNLIPGYFGYEHITDQSQVFLQINCEILDVSKVPIEQYNNLADALDDVNDGETIKLLADINYNTGILIYGMSITFELDGFDLNVVCMDDDVTGDGDALEVADGEVLLDDSNGGEFNVYGLFSDSSCGVYVHNGGKATVTNAEGIYGGVYAMEGIVWVLGDVSGETRGVSSNDGSEVTVDGTITTDGDYIIFDGVVKSYGDYNQSSSKAGYLEYTDGDSYVWVSGTASDGGGNGGGSGFGGPATIKDPSGPTTNPPSNDSNNNNNDSNNRNNNNNNDTANDDDTQPAGKSNTWLWLLLLLLLLIVVVLLYMNRKKIQEYLK